MAAAVFRNTPSMVVPLTQNTAPVLEFDCLYTHDSRKKTKKWQDGFLRYHTFNKRVMVYDVPRNLIGDMHWAGEEAVQCGDELSLERNGVMVEVAEQIGQTETDLTELRKSKNRPTLNVQSPVPIKVSAQTPRAQPAGSVVRSNTQLKHKSLNALLGTPRGPIGKAQLPARSPFEERHANVENEHWADGRPPKRPKFDTAPGVNPARTTSTTSQPAHRSEPPLWARTTDAVKQRKEQSVPVEQQQRLGPKEIIDLSDDVPPTNDFLPGFSDDALVQSSPVAKQRPVTTSSTLGRSSSPAFQVQQPKAKAKAKAVEPHVEVPIGHGRSSAVRDRMPHAHVLAEVAQTEEPEVNRISKQSRQQQDVRAERPKQRSDAISAGCSATKSHASVPASSKAGQTLRLASTGRKKRTLLCQDQLTKKPKRLSSTNTDDAADALLGQADDETQEMRPLTAHDRVEARLAKIRKANKTPKKPSPRKAARAMEPRGPPLIIDYDTSDDDDVPDGPSMGDVQEEQGLPPRRPQTSHEASALELARLDRLMLPPAAPRPKPPAQAHVKVVDSVPLVPPPAQEDRPLRRVVSESTVIPPLSKSKRIPGAPVRYTPSPTRRSRESTPASGTGSRQATPAAEKQQQRPPRSPPDRTAYKKKGPLQKSVSLNMTSNGTSTVMLAKPFQKPGKASVPRKAVEEPQDLGPWSREAFDLFNWRPPGWDEEKWCQGEVTKSGSAGKDTGAAPQPPAPGLSGGAPLPMFGRPVV